MTTGDVIVLTACPAWEGKRRTTVSGLFTLGEFHPAEQGHSAQFELIRYGFDHSEFMADGDDLFEQVHPGGHAKRMADEAWAAAQNSVTLTKDQRRVLKVFGIDPDTITPDDMSESGRVWIMSANGPVLIDLDGQIDHT